MRGHNVCFNGKIRKIIPKLSLLPLLIWSTDFNYIFVSIYVSAHFMSSTYVLNLKQSFFVFTNDFVECTCSYPKVLEYWDT